MIKLKSLLKEVEGTESNVYYHVSFQKYLKKIQKFGIKSKEKGEWKGMMGQDIRQAKGVFVFENYYDAMGWAFKTDWDRKPEKVIILKIKTTDTDFVPDTHWEASGRIGKWLVKQSPIKPEDIIDVIPFDGDKWTPELSLKLRDLKRQTNPVEEITNTIKLKDLLLENSWPEPDGLEIEKLANKCFDSWAKTIRHDPPDDEVGAGIFMNRNGKIIMGKMAVGTSDVEVEFEDNMPDHVLVASVHTHPQQEAELSDFDWKEGQKIANETHLPFMSYVIGLDDEGNVIMNSEEFEPEGLREGKVEPKWEQKISRDDLEDFLVDTGAEDAHGELDYNTVKEISGYSSQWELKEIPLSNFKDLYADPKIVNRVPIITFGSESNWEIADGKHRVGAAKARGEKTIMGYVPVENLNEGKITDKIRPTDRIIMAKKNILPLKFPVIQPNRPMMKPEGLWYALGKSWIDWVKSDMPSGKGEFLYKVEIDMSKILHIKNYGELISFNQKYRMWEPIGKDMWINWKLVSEKYDGIEISPYQYDARLEYMWYYGWDVASGCIWKKDAIKKITRIEK